RSCSSVRAGVSARLAMRGTGFLHEPYPPAANSDHPIWVKFASEVQATVASPLAPAQRRRRTTTARTWELAKGVKGERCRTRCIRSFPAAVCRHDQLHLRHRRVG